MIWATVSSQSCFCWLYRASPSLAAKNIINLILVLTICDVHVESHLLYCWKRVFAMTSVFSWQNSVSLCPALFVLQGQICLLLQVFLDFLLLHSSPLWWKGHLFLVLVLEGLVGLHQFSSVQSCPTLCNPTDHSMPSLPVHHQLPEFTQTHVYQVSDAIQPSHPLSLPSPPSLNLSQHQGVFKWVSSSHQVAKILEFQFQHQSFQWTLRTDLL